MSCSSTPLPMSTVGVPFEAPSPGGSRFDASLAFASRPAFLALVTAVSYYVGSQIGFSLTPTESPIAALWPPNAILLAILLLTPPRLWLILVIAVLPAHLLVQLRTGVAPLTALGWFVGNTMEALLGAACVRYFAQTKGRDVPLFESVRGVTVFLVFGVLMATFVTSFWDAASVVVTGHGGNYWVLWTNRLSSNIVADLTIVPTILTLAVSRLSGFRSMAFLRYLEAGMLAASVVAVSVLVFGAHNLAGSSRALIYAPLPFLLWGAIRFGARVLNISMLAVALIAIWNALHGRGPFGPLPMFDRIFYLHIVLTAFALPLMFAAALFAERRRAETNLRDVRSRLVYAREQERNRIARQLHDDIVQRLALVGLSLDELRSESNALEKQPLDTIYDQISGVSDATRDLSHDLHPFTVDYLGLVGALKKLCQDFNGRGGLTTALSAQNASGDLPPTVARCLFRVAQEALQNAAQHSHASHAYVELSVSAGSARLRVVDNGVGMDPYRGESTGLSYMREQMLSVDGTFVVTSLPAKGIIVEASAPTAIMPQSQDERRPDRNT